MVYPRVPIILHLQCMQLGPVMQSFDSLLSSPLVFAPVSTAQMHMRPLEYGSAKPPARHVQFSVSWLYTRDSSGVVSFHVAL
jgi:hypothetical protein